MKQLALDSIPKRKTFFGGSFLKKSHAKVARPLSTKFPMHIVLKSSQAKGSLSFLFPKNQKIVKSLLKRASSLFRIQVLEFSNNGNHLHLLIRGHRREDIKNFLRTLSALLPRYIQGRHKGLKGRIGMRNHVNALNPEASEDLVCKNSFWDQRAFSRIVEGYKGYVVARDYVLMNHLESLGIISYQTRKIRYLSG